MTEIEVLSQCPPILKNIFIHLPYRELSACAQVCKLWHCMSVTEQKRRTKICSFYQISQCDIHDHDFIPGRMTSSCSEDASTFEDYLQRQLGNLRIKTSFCVAVGSLSMLENFERCFPSLATPEPHPKKAKTSVHKRNFLRTVVKTALQKHFPTNASVALAIAPGIIGIREKPVEVEEGVALTGFCFPDIPGVDVRHIPVDYQKDVKDLIPQDVKCLLLFLTPRGINEVQSLVRSFDVKGDVAVGGAIVETTNSPQGCAIAFCGERVEASTLVIEPRDKGPDLLDKLRIFQETGLVRRDRRCFAFMFACVARGYSHYSEHDKESSAFHSLYPTVPLLGVFGNGEIGFNYFPQVHPENKILRSFKLLKKTRQYFLAYTTVFVLISIKD